MHGHLCDGLVLAACAAQLGLQRLYPNGVIDRTDTGCITNNSPCFGDVAAYVTGGRIRFGTQKIDPTLKTDFIFFRFSTGRSVRVSLKSGVFPSDLAALESQIRAGNFNAEQMRQCQQAQWMFAKSLLERPPDTLFDVAEIADFKWVPDRSELTGRRGDILNKDGTGE
jgi:formylmethanofuran dehydrogenase subunit E